MSQWRATHRLAETNHPSVEHPPRGPGLPFNQGKFRLDAQTAEIASQQAAWKELLTGNKVTASNDWFVSQAIQHCAAAGPKWGTCGEVVETGQVLYVSGQIVVLCIVWLVCIVYTTVYTKVYTVE